MKIVWGIDPGTARIGISIFTIEGEGVRLIDLILIDLTDILAERRLSIIAEALSFFLDIYTPDVVGLEKLLWGKNVKTALEVAEARGVIKYILSSRNIEIVECLPKVVKSVVGAPFFGKDKKAVRNAIVEMFSTEIKGDNVPWSFLVDDVVDSVAIALAVIDNAC